MDIYSLIDYTLERYTPREMATELGVDARTVRRWHARECEPPPYIDDAIRQRLLPLRSNTEAPPAAFTFVDLFAGIGGMRRRVRRQWRRCVLPVNGMSIPADLRCKLQRRTVSLAISPSVHAKEFPITMFYLPDFPVSRSRLPEYRRRTHLVDLMDSQTRRRAHFFSMSRGSSRRSGLAPFFWRTSRIS